MAEYIEVNGRQIRVRPTETVSEVDKYGNFHRQPNHFTKGFEPGENPVEKDRYILGHSKSRMHRIFTRKNSEKRLTS